VQSPRPDVLSVHTTWLGFRRLSTAELASELENQGYGNEGNMSSNVGLGHVRYLDFTQVGNILPILCVYFTFLIELMTRGCD
jgi:hypothetical protein